MPGNNKGWFWTPDRLEKLRRVLSKMAQKDSEGWYFYGTGLSRLVANTGRQEELHVTMSQAGEGLKILVFLEILEQGRQGNKVLAYKRRYYPDKIETIGEAEIASYRMHVKQKRSAST